MSTSTLHYIHDPLCGWCYGAAPLVKAARAVLPVHAHGGGMMAGARRQRVTPQLRAYVLPHDQRIAQLSGQPFGPDYADGLLRDTDAVFDSAPPTAAMLAADELAGRGLDLLARLQVAHYVEGRRIADRAVLIELATALGLGPGLDGDRFAEALDRQMGAPVEAHFQQTRALMARVGAAGFPTFVLERDGALQGVDVGRFLGQPQAFQDWLRDQAGVPTGPAGTATGAVGCDANGCAL